MVTELEPGRSDQAASAGVCDGPPGTFGEGLGRASLVVAVATALVTGALALAGGRLLDLPLHDPNGFLGPTWVRLPLIAVACVAVDVTPRVIWRLARSPHRTGVRDMVKQVLGQRWPKHRFVPILLAIASFYVTYVGYRNLKNFLPFVNESPQDDHLLALDRILAFDHNPAVLLHELLGTGVMAHVLSECYVAFLVFTPISVAVMLIWSKHLSHGLWYVSALCLNWALGALSYYLVPASGPFYDLPWDFAGLPHTQASALQGELVRARVRVLADPHATSSVSGIAAFASLHVSITFTAALIIQLIPMHRVVRWAMWTYFVLVATSTVYFGWHYLPDDIAGLGIGAFSVWLAAGAPRRRRHGDTAAVGSRDLERSVITS